MRHFASGFVTFQGLRQQADYDSTAIFLPSTVPILVGAAEAAMAAFDQADPDERADVLASMLVNPRG